MKLLTLSFISIFALFCTLTVIGQDKFIANKFIIDKVIDEKIKHKIKTYKAVELKISSLKSHIKNKYKYLEGANFILNIEGEDIEFRIFENDIIDENFILIDNNVYTKPKKNDILTYAGYTNNNPEFQVRLFISDKILMGYFNTTNGKYFIQPFDKFRDNSDKKQDYDKIIIYNEDDEIKGSENIACGNFLQNQLKEPSNHTNKSVRITGDNNCKVLKIAVETDNQFSDAYNYNKTLMDANILDWFNQVEEVYVRYFKLRLKVCSISYWGKNSSGVIIADPYPDTNNSIGDVLDKFQKWWRVNRTNVDRNVAHLLTGKGVTYGNNSVASWGDAFINSVCTTYNVNQSPNAYSFTTIRDNVSQTIISNNNIYRNICHEIGHTLGAADIPCTGSGNIMCPLTDKAKNFDIQSVTSIQNFLNSSSASCLVSATSLNYATLFSLKLDGNNISTTPVTISNSTHTLTVTGTNFNTYAINSSFVASKPSVYLYYTNNVSTKFEPNSTTNFSINVSTFLGKDLVQSNSCYYDYWSVPFKLANGFRTNIYPNPSSDIISIEESKQNELAEDNLIQLFDDRGIQIRNITFDSNKQLNISSLPNGVYYLHIINSEKVKEVKRILINH